MKGLGWAAVAAHTSLKTMPILRNGREGQKQKYLTAAIRGEKIAELALSEPGAGSDVVSLRLTAVRQGDHYVWDGSKTFEGKYHRLPIQTLDSTAKNISW